MIELIAQGWAGLPAVWQEVLVVVTSAGVWGAWIGAFVTVTAAVSYEVVGPPSERMSVSDTFGLTCGSALLFGIPLLAVGGLGYLGYRSLVFPLISAVAPEPAAVAAYLDSMNRFPVMGLTLVAMWSVLAALKLPRAFAPSDAEVQQGGVISGFHRIGIVMGLVLAAPAVVIPVFLAVAPGASGAIVLIGATVGSIVFCAAWSAARALGWIVQGFVGRQS